MFGYPIRPCALLCFFLGIAVIQSSIPVLAEESSEKEKRWHIGAKAGIEYDDNLTRVEQDIISNEADHAYTFEVDGLYKLVDTSALELDAGYNFFQSLYEDRSDFDFQSHSFNLSAAHEAEKVDTGLDYSYTYTTLDDDEFLGMHMLIPRVGILLTSHLYTDISYMFMDKNFFSANDRDAANHSIGFSQFFFFMKSKAYVSGGYRFSIEQAKGNEFDYFAHTVKGMLKLPTPLKSNLKVSYKYKVRDYDKITPSIGEERLDNKHTFRLLWYKTLFKIFELKLDYQHIISVSNLATVDFTENIIGVTFGFEL
ncbi:MAG: hypothetical protein ACE5E9_10050 [Nitrospinaceae bacterium]